MKYSLESRCPILDVRVAEFAMSLPYEYKYQRGNKKRILKDLVYEYIPKDLMDRPKVGFSVPLDAWLRGSLKEQVLSMSEKSYLEKQGIFEAAYTEEFLKNYMQNGDAGAGTGANYSRLVWAFFMFQKWYENYMLKLR
jgi:asparagine synthase (glutamine-hydrolysing)